MENSKTEALTNDYLTKIPKKLPTICIGQKTIHAMTRKLHKEPIKRQFNEKSIRTIQKPLHIGQKHSAQSNRAFRFTAKRRQEACTSMGTGIVYCKEVQPRIRVPDHQQSMHAVRKAQLRPPELFYLQSNSYSEKVVLASTPIYLKLPFISLQV